MQHAHALRGVLSAARQAMTGDTQRPTGDGTMRGPDRRGAARIARRPSFLQSGLSEGKATLTGTVSHCVSPVVFLRSRARLRGPSSLALPVACRLFLFSVEAAREAIASRARDMLPRAA